MKKAVLRALVLIVFGCISQTENAPSADNRWIAKASLPVSPNATAVLIDAPDCPACDYGDYVLQLVQQQAPGTEIIDSRRLSYNDIEAKNMISRYRIEKLPVVVLKKNSEWDYRVLSLWSAQFGTFEDDNSLVLRNVYPPYYEISSGQLKGFVTIKLVVNKSCSECYDVDGFTNDMTGAFKFVATKQEVDVESEEGKQLIAQYGIDEIPTFIVSPDAAEYPGFTDFWASKNNTMESDGWFVFRAADELGAYYIKLN